LSPHSQSPEAASTTEAQSSQTPQLQQLQRLHTHIPLVPSALAIMMFSRTFSFLVFFSFGFLLLGLVPHSVEGQFSCSCRCCAGNFCSPTNVGSFSVGSCSSCSNSGCNSNFPTQCPASGQSGSNSASCSSVSSGSAPAWVGSWKANSQCDQSQCCCVVGDYTISRDSNGAYSANIPTLRGSGGCPASATINFGSAPGSSNSFTSSASGNSITYTLSADANQISAVNNANNACSGLSTRNSAFATQTLSKGALVLALMIGIVSAMVI
jgi:hypothetical protein